MAPPLRYLITAPLSLRLDAMETVLLQLFGFTNEVRVYLFLKTSMAPDHEVLAQEAITLNTQNHHQATAKVRVRPNDISHLYCCCHYCHQRAVYSVPSALPKSAASGHESCDSSCPISGNQPSSVHPCQSHQRLPVHPYGQTTLHTRSEQ